MTVVKSVNVSERRRTLLTRFSLAYHFSYAMLRCDWTIVVPNVMRFTAQVPKPYLKKSQRLFGGKARRLKLALQQKWMNSNT
jgi:hypothetical protein